nr:unnamed protein product [Trypanosoma congolense IL3000]
MSQTDSAGDLAGPALVPRSPCVCPLCDETLQWGALLYDLKRRATVDKRQADRMRREAMEAILAQRLERLQCAGSKKSAPRSRSKLGGNGRKRKGANGVSLPSSQSEAGHGDDVLLSGGRDNAVRSASQYGRSVSPTNSASQTSIPLEDILPVTEFNADEWLDL